MASQDGLRGLRFPCECVSAQAGYSDPWAEIAQRKLLPNGTKEQILNLVARGPKTISQLAEALALSAPSVHAHINDMLKSELLRESEAQQKRYPTERFYEPNFPVFRHAECGEFEAVCEEMASQLVAMFERNRPDIDRAFQKTSLADQGWKVTDVTQCLYTNMYRRARTMLEEQGQLTPRQVHTNGAQWIYWAEDPEA